MDAFRKLVESGLINEDVKSELETALAQKLQENRDQVTAELREEFAQKYSHDKTVMVEAIDRMLSDRLAVEIKELHEDRTTLAEAKKAYKQKMSKDSKKLEEFVIRQLGKELVEFQGDRRKVSENFAKLEQFVVHALAREIREFAVDKKDLVETKVKLVKEAQSKFEEIKQRFVKQASKVVENTVTNKLTFEIKQLKEDIDSARTNSFGRKIYEAFAQEYASSYLNEKSETSKLLKIIHRKDNELAESKKLVVEKTKLAESKDREVRITKDLMERKNTMSELLAPLDASKRKIMHDLLESVQTKKLAEAFDKYLPTVMDSQKTRTVSKPVLTEGSEVTGNRESKPEVGLDNILDIRKLAGLK